MKKFKFFKGIIPIERDSNNGVTDPFLIRLSRDIWSYSDWISSVTLTNHNGNTEDFLIFDFKDIDGSEYSCRISIDMSFAILQYIKNEENELELIDTLDISEEVLSDYDNIIQYLSNMPSTIATSL
jgi:hypothetical protein